MKTAIIGYAQTKFKEHWDKGLRELISEAGNQAVKNSNISKKEIDSLICANSLAPTVNGQAQVNALCFDELGLKTSALVSCGDASGASAIRQAIFEIESGKSDIVMVLGVEKISDLLLHQIVSVTSQLLDQESEAYNGVTLPSIFAMITKLYMKEFKVSEEDIAGIPVKNHKNAISNKYAQFSFEIKKESVLKSPIVAEPVRNLNYVAPCDGAAAIILCREDIAEKYCKDPVFIIGSGTGNDSLAFHSRENFTEMKSTKLAAKEAYTQAGIKPEDIEIAEVHDIVSICEIIAVEDLGLCKKGKGIEFIKDSHDFVNPTGGLKACGHPFAATGLRQAIDICNELKKRKSAKYGLTHTLSGTGSLAVVNILSR